MEEELVSPGDLPDRDIDIYDYCNVSPAGQKDICGDDPVVYILVKKDDGTSTAFGYCEEHEERAQSDVEDFRY